MKDLYEAWSEGHAAWCKLTAKEVRELKSQQEPVENRVKPSTKISTHKQKCSRKEDTDNEDEVIVILEGY